ncbi:MAG: hypothetical protein ABF321_02165 [Bacteroidia bacterium]
MFKNCILFILIGLSLTSCKKESKVLFDEDLTQNESLDTVPIIGSKWTTITTENFQFKDLISYDNELILAYLHGSNGRYGYSGTYNGITLNHQFGISGGGSAFDKFKVTQGDLYGVGLIGSHGAWKYISGSKGENWETFAKDWQNFRDIEIFNGKTIVVTGLSPYIKVKEGASFVAMGDSFNRSVGEILVHQNELYAFGSFTKIGDRDIKYIAKWDGKMWQPLGDGVSDNLSGPVNDACIFKDEIVVCGNFYDAGPVVANKIAKWDGNKWTGLDSDLGSFGTGINCLKPYGEQLIVGGLFEKIDGVYSTNIITWENGEWKELAEGVSEAIYNIEVHNGRLFVIQGYGLNQVLKLE